MKLVRFSCPGHADPQPRECLGWQFPVAGTFSLPPPPPPHALRRWLDWARRVAQRLGLAFLQ